MINASEVAGKRNEVKAKVVQKAAAAMKACKERSLTMLKKTSKKKGKLTQGSSEALAKSTLCLAKAKVVEVDAKGEEKHTKRVHTELQRKIAKKKWLNLVFDSDKATEKFTKAQRAEVVAKMRVESSKKGIAQAKKCQSIET